MLNQNHNVHKRTNSKILLIILCIFGLLFSWSCSCKNRVSNPDNTPPQHIDPDTFAIKAATDNVVTSIVKSSTTSISDIKIAFTEANNHDYTMDYTVEDSETDEAKKLTKADFQLANKVLTAKDSVATKVKLVDSSAGPVEKTITINFTFKANDANLKNNTQTLSVEVKLTHAQELKTPEAKKNKIEEIFKAMGQVEPKSGYNFNFGDSQTTFTDSKVEVKNSSAKGGVDGNSLTIDEFKKELLDNPPYGFNQEAVKKLDYISSVKFDESKEQGKINGTIATFYIVLSFNQKYETEDITVQIDADAQGDSPSGKWDTTQNP